MAQWLLFVPPGLILRILTFCPQNEFMSFALFCSEQTAIIALHSAAFID
jgi:hypothetical protein